MSIFTRRQYVQECSDHARRTKLIGWIAAVIAVFSIVQNILPFVDVDPSLLKFPKIPLPWALAIFLLAFLVVVIEGGFNRAVAKEAEAATHALPDFEGKIMEAFVCIPGHMEGNGRFSDSRNSLVIVDVAAWNKVNMSATSVAEYRLELKVNDQSYQGRMSWDANLCTQRAFFNLLTGGARTVDMGSSLGDLIYLSARRGLLMFYVTDLSSEADQIADLSLALVDLVCKEHFITANHMPLIRGRTGCFI